MSWFNSISILDFYFFITFSEYSFNTKVIDISKKNYSKQRFTGKIKKKTNGVVILLI